MYAKKDVLEMLHDDIKRMHRLSSRPIVTHSKVVLPKGMTGGEPTYITRSVRAVSGGNHSQNIRQVFHF